MASAASAAGGRRRSSGQRRGRARPRADQSAGARRHEPLGALDLKLRQQMQSELKALRVGITFVYVTTRRKRSA